MPPRKRPPTRKPQTPAPAHPDAAYKDAARGIRLQKAMAEAGVASRRDCEVLIAEGHVRVNGQVIRDLPAWVDPAQDRIEVDGYEIARPRKSKWRAGSKTYVMLHKPRHVISTTDDPEGRRSVTDLVQVPGSARLFPVGRLDADSTGLLLLTDDGELANRLTHPRYGVAKQYTVSVRGRLTEDDLAKLRDGLYLADRAPGSTLGSASAPGSKAPGSKIPGSKPPGKTLRPTGPRPGAKRASVESVHIVKHEIDRTRGDRTTLAVTLREGQNREIRRLMARLGFKVRKLKRIAIGPLKLKGLAAGAWRPLTGPELHDLLRAAGLKTHE